jgi:hypothetical protein
VECLSPWHLSLGRPSCQHLRRLPQSLATGEGNIHSKLKGKLARRSAHCSNDRSWAVSVQSQCPWTFLLCPFVVSTPAAMCSRSSLGLKIRARAHIAV